ncbi:MAG: hypothetical protein AAFY35_05055 [Pseudomonadota bacterium]
MMLSTLIKIKKIGFAQQVVTGAFINGALIGMGVAAGAIALANMRKDGGMCATAGRKTENGRRDSMS